MLELLGGAQHFVGHAADPEVDAPPTVPRPSLSATEVAHPFGALAHLAEGRRLESILASDGRRRTVDGLRTSSRKHLKGVRWDDTELCRLCSLIRLVLSCRLSLCGMFPYVATTS